MESANPLDMELGKVWLAVVSVVESANLLVL